VPRTLFAARPRGKENRPPHRRSTDEIIRAKAEGENIALKSEKTAIHGERPTVIVSQWSRADFERSPRAIVRKEPYGS
jgi:hypothetical protein